MTVNMRKIINLIEASGGPNLNAAFWQWFGASTVVDNHRQPLTVYHGSNAHAYVKGQIDVFHTRPDSGRGAAFFSSSRQLAGEYGEKVYSVFLRIENPLVVFGNGKGWSSLDHAAKVAGRITPELRAHHRKQAEDLDRIFGDRDLLRDLGLDDEGETELPKSKSKIPDDAHELDRFSLGILPHLEDATFAETDTIVRQARRMGYDGVIFKQIADSPTHDRQLYQHLPSDVYAVFSPYQIKSVDNAGEWDRQNPDIMH